MPARVPAASDVGMRTRWRAVDAGAVAREVPRIGDRPYWLERRSHLTQSIAENIRQGWKVYAGSDVIGEVAYVRGDELGVKSGRLIKHEYVIPIEYVSDAADGVVDLNIGRDAVTKLEPGK